MDAEWNGDEWTCEVDAPAFRSLYERFGTHLAVVFLDAEEEEPPSVEQIASLERFLEVATELRPLVEDAIRAYYFSVRADYLSHLHAPERELPEQLDGREFERLHELQQLNVHRRGENSSMYVALSFRALWEIEHGLGVVTRDAKVVSAGGADSAFLGPELGLT